MNFSHSVMNCKWHILSDDDDGDDDDDDDIMNSSYSATQNVIWLLPNTIWSSNSLLTLYKWSQLLLFSFLWTFAICGTSLYSLLLTAPKHSIVWV